MANEVPEVVISVLAKAEKLLLSTGVQYQIRYPDGTVHGNMPQTPEKPPRKPRRKLSHPWGEITKHVMQYMKADVPVGTVISIPISTYGFDVIQSSASAKAGQLWGKSGYTSHRNRRSNSLELMRNS